MSVRSVLVRYMGDPSGAVAAARTTAAANASVGASARTANARTAQMGAASRTAASGLGILNPKILGPAGLVLGLGHAASSARDFETSAISLRTQIGLTSDEADTAAAAARNVGTQYGIGAQQAIDASWFIHSAGLRGTTATEALEASAQAAAVGFGEVSTVADLVTSAMNAYGPETLSAAEATDILAGAVREGKAEPEELAASMGQVLPIASEMGVEFHELAGVVAAMTRTGTNASTANIQMRQTLMDLLNPTNQARDALAEVGLSAEGLRRQIREEGLFETLMTLQQAFEGNEEGMSQVFSNARSLMGVLDLLGANVDENAAIIESMADTVGLVDDAFDDVQDSSQFAVDQMKAAWSDLMVTLGDMVLPTITSDLNALSAVLRGLTGDFEPVVRMRVEAEEDADAFMRERFADEIASPAPSAEAEADAFVRDRFGLDAPAYEASMERASAATRSFAETAGDAAAKVVRGGREIVGQTEKIPGPLAEVDGGMVDLAESTEAVTEEFIEFMLAMQEWVGGAMDVDRATANWWESLQELEDTLVSGADALDLSTEAGRTNRRAIMDTTETLWDKIDALLSEGASIEELIPLVHGHVDALKEEMRQAGLTEDQIEELIERYGLVPEEVITRIEADDRATSVIGDIQGQLDRLPRNVHTQITSSGNVIRHDAEVSHAGGWVGHGRQMLGNRGLRPGEVSSVLEEGEFVVNARDAQANAGLLQAINSGGVVASRGGFGSDGASSPGSAHDVRVFIGDRELTDIVGVEVDGKMRPLRAASRSA